MQEYHLPLLPCRFERCLKPAKFPTENLLIVCATAFFFKEPSPGTAD